MGLGADGEGVREGWRGPEVTSWFRPPPRPPSSDPLRPLSVYPGQEGGLPQDCQRGLHFWFFAHGVCPCDAAPAGRGSALAGLAPLCTWCWAGRLPPRLYHVMVAWGCPATTQFRSKVCPSTTVGDEDSILMGGEMLGTETETDGPHSQSQPTVMVPGPGLPPPAPTCLDPLPCALSPWEGPLPSMVTTSEVSWERPPLLT